MEWYVPSSTVALHNTPRHSRESNYTGFLGKEKKIVVGPALQYVTRALFWLVAQNYLFNWRDSIRDPIRDPISDPICNPIWSDPDFVDAVKTHFLRRS